MKVKINDTLVFEGNPTGTPHYDNFVVGKQYVVSQIVTLPHDDNVHTDYDHAVCFIESEYGCNLHNIELYFSKLYDCTDGSTD